MVSMSKKEDWRGYEIILNYMAEYMIFLIFAIGSM